MAPIQRPRMKPKMWSWFAPEWMEKVSEDTPITYEEEKPHTRGVHQTMKIKKSAAPVPKTLSELQGEVGKPIEEVATI